MKLQDGCQCEECLKLPDGVVHMSDCATHSEPAYPKGECDCGATEENKEMVFEINYNGSYKDSLIVRGRTIKEIRLKAFKEGDKRGWEREKCWSREI